MGLIGNIWIVGNLSRYRWKFINYTCTIVSLCDIIKNQMNAHWKLWFKDSQYL